MSGLTYEKLMQIKEKLGSPDAKNCTMIVADTPENRKLLKKLDRLQKKRRKREGL